MDLEIIRDADDGESKASPSRRFLVRAPSIGVVRRALHRAPGGAQVVGRHDRDRIECRHTMNGHSYARHWPVILSRLGKAGLVLDPPPDDDRDGPGSPGSL